MPQALTISESVRKWLIGENMWFGDAKENDTFLVFLLVMTEDSVDAAKITTLG